MAEKRWLSSIPEQTAFDRRLDHFKILETTMMRHCDGSDTNLIARNDDTGSFEPCKCGTKFDDVDHSVIYPHQYIRILTDQERTSLDALMNEINDRERTQRVAECLRDYQRNDEVA